MLLLLLTIFSVFGDIVSRADVVTVRRGRPVVLQCEADPGDTLLSVIWKLHLHHSFCLVSYKTEEDNGKSSYSNCSTRMRSDNLSLSINNTEMSDEGNYTCEVVSAKDTVIRHILLQVLAQPSTFVSHPTFVNPWERDISRYTDGITWTSPVVLGPLISFFLILTCVIVWKRLDLRAYFKTMVSRDAQQKQNDPEENKQILEEPYATYTQNENVIYCVATKFVSADETASEGT